MPVPWRHLPVFARPLVRRGFAAKAGRNLQGWQWITAGLTEQLRKVEQGDQAALDDLRRRALQLGELLDRLAGYYQPVPGETARFRRGPATLEEVRRISTGRKEVLRSLVHALEVICAGRRRP